MGTAYPFDYEKSGDNFVISFYVFPYIGKISDDFNKSQITLLDDFANGTVTTLEKDKDDELGGYLLTVEVPSNGANVDDMNLTGTIVFNEGALIEEWGDKAPEFTITSIYNKDFFQITIRSHNSHNNHRITTIITTITIITTTIITTITLRRRQMQRRH